MIGSICALCILGGSLVVAEMEADTGNSLVVDTGPLLHIPEVDTGPHLLLSQAVDFLLHLPSPVSLNIQAGEEL